MDIADMADKFIEDQVLSSVMKIRAQGAARDDQGRDTERCCAVCETLIPRARLRAVPGCSHCIRCAAKQERERAGLFTGVDRQRINAELDDYLLSIC
ncbi:TraR/DksA C4-type zinc finger protein [Sedimenticola sp.]|uniref:TraR/DksA C4-type zinc finger protein n=1 Tax=Sedimenticola sp. TaxID=1940285 RepID=UPI0025854BD9|nr:TraR/DksA C4-type zinc finger protein [Sedimenticola sp.]MCW8905409.1 TraR/DksA C4-type zinc finger protein [Sedimenticola sp.]